MAEQARQVVEEVSKMRIDEAIKTKSFSNEVVEAIRNHIAVEYQYWYQYKKLAHDTANANVALHGFSLLFARAAVECLSDGCFLEKYLLARGVSPQPADIPAPKLSWPDDPIEPLQPLQCCVEMEKRILDDCHRICVIADKSEDYSTSTMISERFLEKEAKHVKNMGDLLKQTCRVSKVPGAGLYTLDRELRESRGKIPWSKGNRPEMVDRFLGDWALDTLKDYEHEEGVASLKGLGGLKGCY